MAVYTRKPPKPAKDLTREEMLMLFDEEAGPSWTMRGEKKVNAIDTKLWDTPQRFAAFRWGNKTLHDRVKHGIEFPHCSIAAASAQGRPLTFKLVTTSDHTKILSKEDRTTILELAAKYDILEEEDEENDE